jgi:DNA-binding Xre family transcriptional regulator
VVAATPGLLLFLRNDYGGSLLKLPPYYVIIIIMDSRFIEVDGAKLRKLRRERALSQQDIERQTRVSQATLSDLEQGKRGARASTLRKLAEALGVEPRELMKEE